MIFQNPFKNRHYIINVIVILLVATVISFMPRDSKMMISFMLIVAYAFGMEMFIVNRVARVVAMIILLALLFISAYINMPSTC